MVKYICPFLSIALVASAIGIHSTAAIAKGLSFKFLGQCSDPRNSTVLGQNRGLQSSSNQQTSFYFLSQNAAGFSTALSDCQAYLGEDASLLQIETEEELAAVIAFLRNSDDTGSMYWTGAKYDTRRRAFVWLDGVEIGPWAPWAPGMPNTRLPVTRVSASTVVGLKLRTDFQTVSHRYICELNVETPEDEAIPCYSDSDLVIVVDSSGSLGEGEFRVALEFAARLGRAWTENPNNRLGVIIYSNSPQSIIGLSEDLDANQAHDRINNASYITGGTATSLALHMALQEFQSNQRSVPKKLVFMTDGFSNNETDTTAAANRLQNEGVHAFSVGFGRSVNPSELLSIAGNNQEHVFNKEGFHDLLRILQPISRSVCN